MQITTFAQTQGGQMRFNAYRLNLTFLILACNMGVAKAGIEISFEKDGPTSVHSLAEPVFLPSVMGLERRDPYISQPVGNGLVFRELSSTFDILSLVPGVIFSPKDSIPQAHLSLIDAPLSYAFAIGSTDSLPIVRLGSSLEKPAIGAVPDQPKVIQAEYSLRSDKDAADSTLAAVPEPRSIVLLSSVLALFLVRRRKSH